jgi:hypothetical protein
MLSLHRDSCDHFVRAAPAVLLIQLKEKYDLIIKTPFEIAKTPA